MIKEAALKDICMLIFFHSILVLGYIVSFYLLLTFQRWAILLFHSTFCLQGSSDTHVTGTDEINERIIPLEYINGLVLPALSFTTAGFIRSLQSSASRSADVLFPYSLLIESWAVRCQSHV